ncbi:LPS export ABC transporter permease LptG [bacterium]|nr:LPS export ABC transporter permease LptG [bacterium]
MIINLYIARRFFGLFLQVFFGFFALMLMIDLIDEIRRFSDPGLTLSEALQLSLMNVPATIYQILPLILILSAIALFVGLTRSSELVVVRAAGRSGLSFVISPVVTALAIGLFAVAVLDPLVAATSRRYDVLSAGHARGGSVLSVSESGLWLRQGGDAGQTVIAAKRANLDGTELYQATFLTFDQNGTPLQRIEAAKATLIPGFWQLSQARSWPLDDDNPQRAMKTLPEGEALATDLTRDRIHDSFGTPSAIGFWALPAYIEGLERAGFSARSHQVWLQIELAQPLLLVAMVLIAAGFTMRPGRMAKTGMLVLLALLAGFGVFFLRNFGQILGDNGQIPVIMAAWAPPLAATFLALGLLLHLEDG